MAVCNSDCLNCIYDDCIRPEATKNAIDCARWYEKNKEKKRAYQRHYKRRKRFLQLAEAYADAN